jgi:preprotein translocase subunit YajC
MEQLTQFAPFLMFVVIYFFMIRPQQKKAKTKRIWKYFKSRW